MTAIREQIAAKVDALLQALANAASGEYERDPSGDPTTFPAFSFTDDGHQVIEAEAGVTRYALDASIEVYAEGSTGAAVSAALNEHHASVVAAIMADPPLDGLAEQITEGDLARFTAMLAGAPRKGFRQKFTIIFPTRRGNPASQ